MILKSVKVENFKSIEDSGEFSIAPVKCLVGKNESGKTSVLQALYKLNPDIPEEGDFNDLLEYPRRKWSVYKERRNTKPDNVLTTKWELETTDIAALTEKYGPKIIEDKEVLITKGYDNKLKWRIKFNEKQLLKN